MRGTVAALALLAASSSALAMGEGRILPPPIPAHWVDDATSLEPRRFFRWTGLSFRSPDEGWIVGDHYLLHVLDGGERLELIFLGLNPSFSLKAIDAYGPGEVVAGGMRFPSIAFSSQPYRAYGAIMQLAGGHWSAPKLADIPLFDWSIHTVRMGTGGLGWALGIEQPEEFGPVGGFVLRGENGEWRLDRSVDNFGEWNIGDMCVDARGDWWFVGADNDNREAAGAVILRLREGKLEQVALPPSLAAPSALGSIACLPDGSLMALGGKRGERPDGRSSSRLVRYDPGNGSWQVIALPEELRWFHLYELAAVSASEAWMTGSDSIPGALRPTVFLHWHDELWDVVPLPPVPSERERFSVEHLTFVSPDEGWAVGNCFPGGYAEGLIFHYKHGQWRYRAWNYHFWNDLPWSLFGF